MANVDSLENVPAVPVRPIHARPPLGQHCAKSLRSGSKDRFGELLGGSLAMRQLFPLLERIAASHVPVLIEGETGTGKEVAARSIHAASPRASGPYVIFDCGAIPRDLAESELFGHRRGSFTGATGDRMGAFNRAHGGTILLDEIGELPIELQPKLLRVLETGEVRSVGDDTSRRVDVRVLAATNRDLRSEVGRGTFRHDLLYRLDVLRVPIPPLRDRPEDIAPIAARLLEGQLIGPAILSCENLDRLCQHSWPGNVRELRNVLMRAVVMATGPEGAKPRATDLIVDLAPAESTSLGRCMSYPGVATPLPYKVAKEELLAGFESAYVRALLLRHNGVIRRAAIAAGISRKHLHELVQRFDLRCTNEGDDPQIDTDE
ncbi:MAG TPA: sigma-54 dependent transcriptional regulator [Polyangia bacterium]